MRPVQWDGRGETPPLRLQLRNDRPAFARKQHDVLTVPNWNVTIVPDQRSDNVQPDKIVGAKQIAPVFRQLLVVVPSTLLARQRGRKQHKIGVTNARRDDRRAGLGSEMLRHLQAEDKIEAAMKIQMQVQVGVQDPVRIDFQKLRIDLLLFDTDDVAPPIGSERAQPSPSATAEIQHTGYFKPPVKQVGNHRRRVTGRSGETLMVAEVRVVLGLRRRVWQ